MSMVYSILLCKSSAPGAATLETCLQQWFAVAALHCTAPDIAAHMHRPQGCSLDACRNRCQVPQQSSKQRMMTCNIQRLVSCSPVKMARPAIGTTNAGSSATMQEMAIGPPSEPLRELKADYDAQRRQLEQENASLRAEVEQTRLLLAQPSGDMQTIAAVERQHSSGSRVQLAQGLSREHSPGKQVLSEDNARLKRELARLRDRSRGHSASKGAASGNAEDDALGSQHLLKHNSVTWQ